MAKLNWLVQLRHAQTNSSMGQPVWLDCGAGTGAATDAYGNEGYQDKAAAIAALSKLRLRYKNEAYRLIRIAE